MELGTSEVLDGRQRTGVRITLRAKQNACVPRAVPMPYLSSRRAHDTVTGRTRERPRPKVSYSEQQPVTATSKRAKKKITQIDYKESYILIIQESAIVKRTGFTVVGYWYLLALK